MVAGGILSIPPAEQDSDMTEKTGTGSRGRGRPRTFDKARALQAALALFWRHGYDGTSIAQLTAAMKISAPSLYAAFGSKEALYREVLELYMATHGAPAARALGAPGPAREAIRNMLKEAALQVSRAALPKGCLVANGALQCGRENQVAARETGALRRLGRDAIRQRLDHAVRQRELPARTDTAALAAYYASVVQGMSVQAVDGASRAQLLKLGEYAMAAWPGK